MPDEQGGRSASMALRLRRLSNALYWVGVIDRRDWEILAIHAQDGTVSDGCDKAVAMVEEWLRDG